jgi:hypothetical protein
MAVRAFSTASCASLTNSTGVKSGICTGSCLSISWILDAKSADLRAYCSRSWLFTSSAKSRMATSLSLAFSTSSSVTLTLVGTGDGAATTGASTNVLLTLSTTYCCLDDNALT